MRKRKAWTADDTEALAYWHASRLTDGRIALKLHCCRRTILRQRDAMGLRAVAHPNRRDGLKKGISSGGRLGILSRQC